jgi:thymidylate kinase
MVTVALIGPDGVGKTTVGKRLEASFPHPIKYIYMGLNSRAANYSLPTTQFFSARRRRKLLKYGAQGLRKRRKTQQALNSTPIPFYKWPIIVVRKTLGLSHSLLEEWYRHLIAWVYEKRGYIVILDRHFIYDFYNSDGFRKEPLYKLKRKIHDFLLKKTVAEPELVICLDAPSEVVFKRKQEFDSDDLEMKRKKYLQLGPMIKNFIVIDANRNLDSVVKDVGDRIIGFQKSINKHERY